MYTNKFLLATMLLAGATVAHGMEDDQPTQNDLITMEDEQPGAPVHNSLLPDQNVFTQPTPAQSNAATQVMYQALTTAYRNASSTQQDSASFAHTTRTVVIPQIHAMTGQPGVSSALLARHASVLAGKAERKAANPVGVNPSPAARVLHFDDETI